MHYVKLIKYHIYGITATVSSQNLSEGVPPVLQRSTLQYEGKDIKIQWSLFHMSHYIHTHLKTEILAS